MTTTASQHAAASTFHACGPALKRVYSGAEGVAWVQPLIPRHAARLTVLTIWRSVGEGTIGSPAVLLRTDDNQDQNVQHMHNTVSAINMCTVHEFESCRRRGDAG